MAARPQSTVNVFQPFAVDAQTPFDIEKLSDKFRFKASDWSIPQAILCILISTAMADGHFDLEEEETIKQLARRSRSLSTLDPNQLSAANDVVNERLANRPNALKEACETLPADMCLPIFANAVDIVLSDGELLKPEAEFLQKLMADLDIEQDHARRVMEVLLLKHQY